MGVAGASLADDQDAVSSMGHNPAVLGFLDHPDLYITVAGAWAEGRYENARGRGGELTDTWGVLPEIVLRTPLGEQAGLGLSIIPESTRVADWFFEDPEGGIDGGTSYGHQHHRSEIINVRTALGLGLELHEKFAVGASVGLVYTQNTLSAPYVFQSHPVLSGFKTLLDMETDGFGVNGDLALHWKTTKTLSLAFSYRTPTEFKTEGEASGDITEQLESLGLAGVPGGFHYDADIATALPQKLALGARWEALPRLRLSGQVEWVNWSRAYDRLEVNLDNGSNEAINGLLGSDGIQDEIALDWEDRFVYRTGLEFDLTQSVVMRAGYAYGKSPVPLDTLLPMTAAISEHTVALGMGYKRGPWQLDLAYQYDLPVTQEASARSITGSEYKNSSVEVEARWVGISLGLNF